MALEGNQVRWEESVPVVLTVLTKEKGNSYFGVKRLAAVNARFKDERSDLKMVSVAPSLRYAGSLPQVIAPALRCTALEEDVAFSNAFTAWQRKWVQWREKQRKLIQCGQNRVRTG